MDRLTFTVPEVAAQLGVPAKTVYYWVERGILPHFKVQRRVLIPAAALEQWVVTRQVHASSVPQKCPTQPRRRRIVL